MSDRTVSTTVSEEEFAYMSRIAADQGVTVWELVRRALSIAGYLRSAKPRESRKEREARWEREGLSNE